MRKFNLLVCFLMLACVYQLNAQCTQCTPVSCSALKPGGGLCNFLPDDTAGVPYDAVVSFYMPTILNDPTTLSQCSGCSYIELHHITIVGIQGLPTGVTGTANHANNFYDVWGGDSTGCVHFCGTPVAPGTYYMIVNLLADVVAVGTPIGNVTVNGKAQTYQDTIQIFPGTSECPQTFSIGTGPCVTKACDSVNVDLKANLTNTDCPNLISYNWSMGNGQTSDIKNPGAINYNTPDTFPLSLTTTFYTYRIKSVYVNITGGYSGDIEELTSLSSPDPYIIIPSLGFNNRSNAGSDSHTILFDNLNLIIPGNNCADPIEIQAWDEDTGPPQGSNPLGSPDDNCGSHYITPAVPNQVSDLGSNSGIAVTFDTVATSSVTENVNIIVFPHPPVPVLVVSADSICDGDSSLISLNQAVPGYAFSWYKNDTTQLQSSDSAIWVFTAGTYKVQITNVVTGCQEWSAPHTVAVGTAAPPEEFVYFTGTVEFITPFPSGFSADWYYNGNLVAGQNGQNLNYLGDGVYQAQVYNSNFPFCRVTSYTDTVQSTSITDLAATAVYNLSVYPNPNSGIFNIRFSTNNTESVDVKVLNTVGQMVYAKKLENHNGEFNEEMNLSELSKGVYFVSVESKNGKQNTKVVVQ